jgi:hypothetical protein
LTTISTASSSSSSTGEATRAMPNSSARARARSRSRSAQTTTSTAADLDRGGMARELGQVLTGDVAAAEQGDANGIRVRHAGDRTPNPSALLVSYIASG